MVSLLTVIVAFFGIWIAFSQWYLARSRLKLDLFDRRLAVVNLLRDLIGDTLQDFEVDLMKLWKFGYDTVGTRWLFDDSVEEYLKLVAEKIHETRANKLISEYSPPTLESISAREKVSDTMIWLVDQTSKIETVFGPFMRIDEPLHLWAKRKLLEILYIRTNMPRWLGRMKSK